MPRRNPLLLGLQAAKANLIPGFLLQLVMLAIVLAYYNHEPTRRCLGNIAGWKQQYGYVFTFMVTGFAGGIVPELLKVVILQRLSLIRENLVDAVFGFIFWGAMACVVDTFYRAQGVWFGNETTPFVLFKKVVLDQFVFTPFVGTFSVVCAFEWKASHYSFQNIGRFFTPAFYRSTILPRLIAGWGVWIPAVTLIYSLPPLLQIPLFALTTSFWSLLITYMAGRGEKTLEQI